MREPCACGAIGDSGGGGGVFPAQLYRLHTPANPTRRACGCRGTTLAIAWADARSHAPPPVYTRRGLRKNSRFSNSVRSSSESVPRALASSCTSKVYEFSDQTEARHGRIPHFYYPRLLVGPSPAAGTGCCNFIEAPFWTNAGKQRHTNTLLEAAARPLAIPRRRPSTAGNRTIGPDGPMEFQ